MSWQREVSRVMVSCFKVAIHSRHLKAISITPKDYESYSLNWSLYLWMSERKLPHFRSKTKSENDRGFSFLNPYNQSVYCTSFCIHTPLFTWLEIACKGKKLSYGRMGKMDHRGGFTPKMFSRIRHRYKLIMINYDFVDRWTVVTTVPQISKKSNIKERGE